MNRSNIDATLAYAESMPLCKCARGHVVNICRDPECKANSTPLYCLECLGDFIHKHRAEKIKDVINESSEKYHRVVEEIENRCQIITNRSKPYI